MKQRDVASNVFCFHVPIANWLSGYFATFKVVVVFLILFAGVNVAHAQENFAVEVLNLVNAERAKVGAPPLKLAADLQQASAIRAREIIQTFSHTRPDGSSCFTVIQKRGRTCGENIAAGHASAAETVEQWMNSDGHRENILNPAFRELGVGYAYEDYSTYHHYWVQLFRG